MAQAAIVVDDPTVPAGLSPDPDDDYLIALARAVGADFLVSGDSHLTERADPSPPILTPRTFLGTVSKPIRLWRPVGQAELDLIAANGWRRFPARLEGQPIFYPVLNEAYATRIARDWNTKDPASRNVGYVLRFDVDAEYLSQFEPHRVGGAGIDELWVPAGELERFNDHIVGQIEVISEYRATSSG